MRKKANEPSENLRVVGIARSFDESSLRSDAINNAQIQIAHLVSAAIEELVRITTTTLTKMQKLPRKVSLSVL